MCGCYKDRIEGQSELACFFSCFKFCYTNCTSCAFGFVIFVSAPCREEEFLMVSYYGMSSVSKVYIADGVALSGAISILTWKDF